jgi:ribosome-interacting GTPase 1
MASTNQSPFYKEAEKNFLLTTTPEEKIACLEIMIRECPKHKSSENMLQNLTRRLKRFKQSLAKSKKSGKGKKEGIKKADMQAVLIGFPNTGKSSLFNLLTNQNSKISPLPYTTYEQILGTINYENTKIQIIDSPPFPSHNKSLINSTDTLLLVIDNIEQIKKAENFINKSQAEIVIIYNKADLLNGKSKDESEKAKRKIEATLKSKKLNFSIISSTKPDKNNIEQLKKKIFDSFVPKKVIRIYTKEPHKPATKEPMILKQNSTVEEVAEKILKGMSKKIKRTKIWGPSSKFSGQIIGLEHKLKDQDTIEFQTK